MTQHGSRYAGSGEAQSTHSRTVPAAGLVSRLLERKVHLTECQDDAAGWAHRILFPSCCTVVSIPCSMLAMTPRLPCSTSLDPYRFSSPPSDPIHNLSSECLLFPSPDCLPPRPSLTPAQDRHTRSNSALAALLHALLSTRSTHPRHGIGSRGRTDLQPLRHLGSCFRFLPWHSIQPTHAALQQPHLPHNLATLPWNILGRRLLPPTHLFLPQPQR